VGTSTLASIYLAMCTALQAGENAGEMGGVSGLRLFGSTTQEFGKIPPGTPRIRAFFFPSSSSAMETFLPRVGNSSKYKSCSKIA